MDIDGILDDSTVNNDALVITPAIRDFLSQSAGWGKFIAIVGLVLLGLLILVVLLGGGGMMMMLAGSDIPLGGGGGTVFFLIFAGFMALLIIPLIFLYNFSTKLKIALREDNQMVLADAFENHKSFFKFYGILLAIFVGFYALIFLFGLVGSLFAALGG